MTCVLQCVWYWWENIEHDPFKYIEVCYSYELDTCTGADTEIFQKGEGSPKKVGDLIVFLNIACLFML